LYSPSTGKPFSEALISFGLLVALMLSSLYHITLFLSQLTLPSPEDGGSRFLQNIGTGEPKHIDVTPWQSIMLMLTTVGTPNLM
jgi:hypothetical protein